jgi:transposase
MMARRRTPKGPCRPSTLLTIPPYAAGSDLGSCVQVVAVPLDLSAEPVRTSQSFPDALHRMADWRVDLGITTVAMGSKGIYWLPAVEIVAARGLDVLLVHARQVKNVPGRKTEVHDACWLQQLHQHGLRRGSVRPAHGLAALRASLRQRARLVEYAAAHIEHMQKALRQMNGQWHHVMSDLTGGRGLKSIGAIVAGLHEPPALAASRDVRCNASEETVRQALPGNFRPEHVFALRQALELSDSDQAQVAAGDHASEAVRVSVEQANPETALPAARHKTRAAHAPTCTVRVAFFPRLGTELTPLHGFGAYTAVMLIGECGTAMTKCPPPNIAPRGSRERLATRAREGRS